MRNVSGNSVITERDNMCDDYTVEMYFYSNACHVCRIYGNGVKLKRCSSCKMIAYCGREHQRKHWPRHKELCRVFAEIMQQAGTIFGARDKRDNRLESWTRAKTNLILLIQIKLGRKLAPYETEMLQFPRSCDTCHETDSRKLVDCTECPFASFCHDHKANNDHAKKCETSRLCFTLDTAQYYESIPDLIFAKETNKNIPKSMLDVIRIYLSMEFNNEVTATMSALVSEYFTRPYTFLHAKEKLNCSIDVYTCIHVIGANAIELKSLAYWEILLHHYETMKKMKIVLVGPELDNENYEMELCDRCANKKIFVKSVSEFYADYAASKNFEKPDYIVGFNLGIHECESLDNDTWAPSIKQLAKLNCPFFMTSYTLQESREERERLNLVIDNNVKYHYSGKNVFSSLRPYRDFESQDFFYQNQYLTIYEKLC